MASFISLGNLPYAIDLLIKNVSGAHNIEPVYEFKFFANELPTFIKALLKVLAIVCLSVVYWLFIRNIVCFLIVCLSSLPMIFF